jgi:hypothetical protein
MFWRKKEPQTRLTEKTPDQREREFNEVYAVRVKRSIDREGVFYHVEIRVPSYFEGDQPFWFTHCDGIKSYDAAVKTADLLFKTKGEPETVYEIGPQDRGTRP